MFHWGKMSMVKRSQRFEVTLCKVVTVAILGVVGLFWLATAEVHSAETARSETLLDLSGMTWVEGDLFLGVHDAKDNPKKHDWPRVSLIHLPKSELEGVTWRTANLDFPGPQGRASDLESVCRLPSDKGFLFCESGQEGPDDRRIFHAVMRGGRLQIVSHIVWPVPIKNVEATEVCRVGDKMVFLYAERADSLPSTELRWATFSLDPLKIGEFEEVSYRGIDPVGEGARPIVAMDVDSDGLIYIVSAFDTGSDDGPFRSVVWQIGRVVTDSMGNAKVELGESKRLGTLDGLKVESITVRERANSRKQIYVGTDDEHFGGILRLLP